jgi:hypothetical protein
MAVGVRRFFSLLNVAVAFVTLASALAVLYSDLAVPGYREHHRDALWFVTAYAAVQVVMLVEFARDGRYVPGLALLKAVVAWLFLANFTSLWPYWQTWTPARYVYQLFDWGESTRIGLYGLVFLGRGAWNTLNAFYFTQPWWRRLRITHPFLGRIVTALPPGGMVLCLWLFAQLVREEAQTFSPEAQAVARVVYEGLDCDAVRANDGKTTDDVRQRGERRYQVRIAWGCEQTRVLVRTEDGRMGAAAGSQRACCVPPATSIRSRSKRA